MCRIAGIISKQITPEELTAQVQLMCDALKHGGPDDEGVLTFGNERICLGHRRLSILDLSKAGHQPMFGNNNKLCLTFNGEIYNFKDIRSELSAFGYSFHTNTDTEVILVAYQHWGTTCFSKFNGMFAFTLVDFEIKKTFLVRDPSGIKPLYYFIKNDTLIFSSEVKAFLKTNQRFDEDERWRIYLLALGHIPEPYTNLKSVYSLPKGSFLVWDNETSANRIESYYR